MIFTSLTFLVFFFILISLLLLSKNNSYRTWVLLVGSYVFYGWWNTSYLLLIFFISFIGWFFGMLIDAQQNKHYKSLLLTSSVTICLAVLAYFKYASFILDNFSLVIDVGSDPIDILLPVGISFFTFQTLSYLVDVSRKTIPVCRSFTKFALYVAFFPQLVAGPIVRASDFLPQLDQHIKLKKENIIIGIQLFLGGAMQKVLIADSVSPFVDGVYSLPELYSTTTLWLGVFAYSVQIFGDFAGYSLMAIGIARILGFTLPKNFNMPYNSLSIVEFWRRWHISLSSWLRDYLYISLGGNRKGERRVYVNLFITMLLGGLWHGSSWNFVLWGVLHGAALGINKWWNASKINLFKRDSHLYSLFCWMLTLVFVSLAWVPFRSSSFENTQYILSQLFIPADGIDWFHTPTLITFLIVIVWHVLSYLDAKVLKIYPVKKLSDVTLLQWIGILSVFYMVLLFSPINASPFIYFQF